MKNCATCQQPFEVGISNTRQTCSPACYRIWRNELARVAYYTRQQRKPKPKTPKLDPTFGHWFAGFTDGEGCFLIQPIKVNGVTYYAAKFTINLRVDDLPILQQIQKALGFGKLQFPKRAKLPIGANPTARFEIAHGYDLWRLVEVFEHFPLRAKKQRDFEIWKRFVELHKTRSNATNGELEKLYYQLQNIRKYKSVSS